MYNSQNTLINYILYLADNALILSHKNSEWCGHGPILEQDIALTNISLDLLGQARNFYQYAANLLSDEKQKKITEDDLAYLRTEREFKNCLLVEQPNGDWACTILRQYLFSQLQYLLYEKLQENKDVQIAAIASKAIKEVAYHIRWSADWVLRLGDGTAESNARMNQAFQNLWAYTGEMFDPATYETNIDLDALKLIWDQKTDELFKKATLETLKNTFMQKGGKQGLHSEHLGYILTELQYLQRVYPNCEW